MNEYEATEVAFKNGYLKGIEDFADRAKTVAFDNVDDAAILVLIYKAVDRIAKELERGKDNASL